MNLSDRWPGRSGKGSVAPVCRDVPAFWDRAARRGHVVLAGLRVANALAIPMRFFRTYRFAGTLVHVIPHPSGVNRAWNDPVIKTLTAELLTWVADPKTNWDLIVPKDS